MLIDVSTASALTNLVGIGGLAVALGAALLALGLVGVARRGSSLRKESVARGVVVPFVLLAAIILGQTVAVLRFARRLDSYHGLLQIAGSQHSLSQRIEVLAWAALDEVWARDSLRESVHSFDDTLNLIEGGGGAALSDRRETEVSIANERGAWERVRPRLLAVVAGVSSDADGRSALARNLKAETASLRSSTAGVVESLQSGQQSSLKDLFHVSAVSGFLSIAVLLAAWGLVWERLVWPVRRLRVHALSVSAGDPDDATPNEIHAVSQVVTDISRRLRRAEVDYRSIFDNAVAGILRFDGEGKILLANPALARMLGFSSADELETTVTDVHQQLFTEAGHRERFEKLLGDGAHVEQETPVRRRDGTTLWVLESARATDRHGDGRVYETVIVDVTQLKEARESLSELSGLLLRSQDRERRRMARELHDSTGQLLAALQMNLERLDELFPVFRESLSSSVELTTECSRQIRSLSYLLHPPLLEELGLVYALRDYSRGFSKRSGIGVELEISSEMPRLDADAELALFRVVQEALTNIQRHSNSPDAVLRLTSSPRGVHLEIEDHGCGIPRELQVKGEKPGLSRMGIGIRGMEERLRQLGGHLTIESKCGLTIVRADLPCPTRDTSPAARR